MYTKLLSTSADKDKHYSTTQSRREKIKRADATEPR
jgi:hypothetical protein